MTTPAYARPGDLCTVPYQTNVWAACIDGHRTLMTGVAHPGQAMLALATNCSTGKALGYALVLTADGTIGHVWHRMLERLD